MDYADSQSGLRSLNIPRHTGMERGGAINLVFDDSVSVKNIVIRLIAKNKIQKSYYYMVTAFYVIW
jgi:hypothetical protein